jgi:L-alanine-DL-glutamate epimerase-like enolase superfamily enzyme
MTDKENGPPEAISPEEAFRNGYYYFIEAVESLAADADATCRMMGDFNVAWELKDDVSAGRYLLGKGFLAAHEEACIAGLLQAVDSVPVNRLPGGTGRNANLQAMSDSCWDNSRSLAQKALLQLKSFTESNLRALGQ